MIRKLCAKIKNAIKAFIRKCRKLSRKLKDSFFVFLFVEKLRQFIQEELLDKQGIREDKENEKETGILRIAFYPTGGFGDYIISSKLLDELLSYSRCHIDVYCENMTFGAAIYGMRPNITIVPYADYERSKSLYDLSLRVEHFIHVLECKPRRIAKVSPEFMDVIEALGRSISHIRPDIVQQCFRENIHFRRCAIKGINRWTELRHENVFQIADQWSGVYLQKEGLESLEELGLDKCRYITINRGADSMGRSTLQTKVWSKEYYEQFVELFKQKYQDIKVVQLGNKGNAKVEGADEYIFGESFETVKWILKRSLLHIDCEGGLVHLATQLATKCVVIFGPTPMHFYSYPQNINLMAGKCHNCMGTHADWAFSCYKGMKEPECMYSVTAEMVMDAIESYMKGAGKREYNFTVCDADKLQCSLNGKEYEELRDKIVKRYKVATYKEDLVRQYMGIASAVFSSEQYKEIAVVGGKRDWIAFLLKSKDRKVVCFDEDFGCEAGAEMLTNEYMAICRKRNIDARLCSIYSLPYESDSFDCVLVYGQKINMDEISRITRQGADVFRIYDKAPGGNR